MAWPSHMRSKPPRSAKPRLPRTSRSSRSATESRSAARVVVEAHGHRSEYRIAAAARAVRIAAWHTATAAAGEGERSWNDSSAPSACSSILVDRLGAVDRSPPDQLAGGDHRHRSPARLCGRHPAHHRGPPVLRRHGRRRHRFPRPRRPRLDLRLRRELPASTSSPSRCCPPSSSSRASSPSSTTWA